MRAAPAHAQALDPTASEALSATLRMLLDPAHRSIAIAGSPQAGAIDQQIRALTGSDARIQELTQALDRARTDPSGFAAMLSPATLERLRQLATKISDQRR